MDAYRFPKTLLFLILSVVALFYIIATEKGVGITPDSVSYIWGAKSITQGDGYSFFDTVIKTPITHWPPGYSIVLSGSEPITGDFFLAARLVNLLLLLAVVYSLIGLFMQYLSPKVLIVVCTTTIFLLSPSVLPVFSMAWSEPLFIFVTLLSLKALVKFTETNKQKELLISAFFAGASFIVRYAGIAVILTGISYLLSHQNSVRKNEDIARNGRGLMREETPTVRSWVDSYKRVKAGKNTSDAFVFSLISLPWVVGILLRNHIVRGINLQNTTGLITDPVATFSAIFAVVGTWFRNDMPSAASGTNLSNTASGVLFIIFLLTTYLITRNAVKSCRVLNIFVLYIVIYLFTFLGAVVFDNSTIDFRTFAPVYPYLLFIAAFLINTFFHSTKSLWPKAVVFVAFTYYLGHSSVSFFRWTRTAQSEGLGANKMRSSEVLNVIRTKYSDRQIFSNKTKIALHLLNTPASPLLQVHETDYFKSELSKGRAILILFADEWVARPNEFTDIKYIKELNLIPVAQDKHIRLYAY